jgi:hypothetical protein
LSLDRLVILQQDDSLGHHQGRLAHGMAMMLDVSSSNREYFGIQGGMKPLLFL